MKAELVTLFQSVTYALSRNKKWNRKSLLNFFVRIIYKRLGVYIKKPFSYNFFALSFNQEFFLKNFLKNLLLLNFLDGTEYCISQNIIDVGSGAAPASIALSMLTITKCGKDAHLHIELIDKSYRQLELAKELCRELSINVISCRNEEFLLNGQQYNSLVVFSYFICEQDRSFIKLLYQHKDCFKNGFIILDYKYVVERVKKVFEQHGDSCIRTVCLRTSLPESIASVLHEKEVNVYGCYFENK